MQIASAWRRIVRDTAVGRNAPIRKLAVERKKVDISLIDLTRKHVMCLRKYKEKRFFFLWTQHFDSRCVCNPAA